jgi:hypothetical protein
MEEVIESENVTTQNRNSSRNVRKPRILILMKNLNRKEMLCTCFTNTYNLSAYSSNKCTWRWSNNNQNMYEQNILVSKNV